MGKKNNESRYNERRKYPAHLDDLHQLINATIPRKQGFSEQQLRRDAP